MLLNCCCCCCCVMIGCVIGVTVSSKSTQSNPRKVEPVHVFTNWEWKNNDFAVLWSVRCERLWQQVALKLPNCYRPKKFISLKLWQFVECDLYCFFFMWNVINKFRGKNAIKQKFCKWIEKYKFGADWYSSTIIPTTILWKTVWSFRKCSIKCKNRLFARPKWIELITRYIRWSVNQHLFAHAFHNF